MKVELTTRTRNETGPVSSPLLVDGEKCGVVAVDCWNLHWCRGLESRLGALVPRINFAFDGARALGMQVFWCPTDVVDAYAGEPGFVKALQVPEHDMPSIITPRKMEKEIERGECVCGPGFSCRPQAPWDAMHPGLNIDSERDLWVDGTYELYCWVKELGIEHLIYAGVHTNFCVLDKSVGMRAMANMGFSTILARDLTDAQTGCTRVPGDRNETPDVGTADRISHIERYFAPSINLGMAIRKSGVLDASSTAGMPTDHVFITPFASRPDRRFPVLQPTVVTMCLPNVMRGEPLEAEHAGCTIHYTLDGTRPTMHSPAYNEPLVIDGDAVVRAIAFRKGEGGGIEEATLESASHFVKIIDEPPLSGIFASDVRFDRCSRYHEHPVVNASFDGNPLEVDGREFKKGFGILAPSYIQFDLEGERYARDVSFVTTVAVDETFELKGTNHAHGDANIIFKVAIDGIVVAESPVMHMFDHPFHFNVPMPEGARFLTLIAVDAGKKTILNRGCWLNAGFLSSKKR